MSAAFAIAWRELRNGIRGFGIFLACLGLGVAAIAAAGSLNAAFNKALTEDARALLGGDAEMRLAYRAPDAQETTFVRQFGRLSESAEMRAMARTENNQTLVEMKAVDNAYPLYGQVTLSPEGDLRAALTKGSDGWGAAADPNLLDRLGLKIGDPVKIGSASFVLRATIAKEPDRVSNAFAFGPRLLVSKDALNDTGLVQPGSLIRHVMLVRFSPDIGLAVFKAKFEERFPHAGWQIRAPEDAAPGIKRFIDNLTQFLSLVGLTSLLVGGIGVANAVRAFMETRLATIATLKCLGASNGTILRAYALQLGALSGVGILAGLAAGAALPWILAFALRDKLPISPDVGLFPAPLALAALFGALTAFLFSAWPLAQSCRVSPAMLFRDIAQPVRVKPSSAGLGLILLTAVALAGLAIVSAPDHRLAGYFVAGSAATFALFAALAEILIRAARLIGQSAFLSRHGSAFALAISSLRRPGGATRSVVLSLGLGLTVLVTVALIQANLSRQFAERMPEQAPTFFFIDIQPDQLEAFTAAVTGTGGKLVASAPMVRGRIVALNGTPIEQAQIAPEAEWAVRGDRGLSAAAEAPKGARIVAGAWWPRDYDGPPLVSLDAGIAKGFGLSLGQTITVNVLGREITARIANLREIDWTSLSMNFTFLLTPSALAGAPATYIATVRAADGHEGAVERAVATGLPTISSIRVREALEQAREVVDNAALAISAAAAVTLVAGLLVLTGAVAAGRERRIREAVLMKVLGARRADLIQALLLEFLLLGGITGMIAGLLGALAARALLIHVLHADWVLLPLPLGSTLGLAIVGVGIIGILGTRKALSVRAARYLRHA